MLSAHQCAWSVIWHAVGVEANRFSSIWSIHLVSVSESLSDWKNAGLLTHAPAAWYGMLSHMVVGRPVDFRILDCQESRRMLVCSPLRLICNIAPPTATSRYCWMESWICAWTRQTKLLNQELNGLMVGKPVDVWIFDQFIWSVSGKFLRAEECWSVHLMRPTRDMTCWWWGGQ